MRAKHSACAKPPPKGILQLFESLKGVWELYRHWDGIQGYMQGMAFFQPRASGVLSYQEQGRATFRKDKTFLAYRTYTYVYEQDTIAVYLGDREQKQPARLLHTLQFHSARAVNTPLVATGTHVCADDVYRACYTFVSSQHFQLTYQVHGPRKDYTIQTSFNKVTDTT